MHTHAVTLYSVHSVTIYVHNISTQHTHVYSDTIQCIQYHFTVYSGTIQCSYTVLLYSVHCTQCCYKVYITRKYIQKSGLFILVSLTCAVKNSSLNWSNGKMLCKTYATLRCVSLTVFLSVNRHFQNSKYLLLLKFQLWSIIADWLNY